MTSTSAFFGPGGSTTSVTRQILNRQTQSGKNPTCACVPPSSNKRIYDTSFLNSAGQVTYTQVVVNPDNNQTTSQRISSIIKHYPGGRVQFGNPNIAQSTTFLGRVAGQPGGIIGLTKIQNKF